MLDFQLSTILFTVVNVLVLYLFLRKFLFGRVTAILDQRQALVKEAVDSAEASRTQAEALRLSYEQKLSDAQQEAEQITADARARAQRTYDAKLRQAEADARKVEAAAQAQIASQRRDMLRGARREVASLALLAASKAAGKSVDSQDERALVDAFLSEVGDPV